MGVNCCCAEKRDGAAFKGSIQEAEAINYYMCKLL